jgi:hypothetical protein
MARPADRWVWRLGVAARYRNAAARHEQIADRFRAQADAAEAEANRERDEDAERNAS